MQTHIKYTRSRVKIILENVAITMYCHRRPPDAMPLLIKSENVLGPWTRETYFRWLHLHFYSASPPYSARVSAIYFLPFGNIWLGSVSVCNAWEAQCRIYEGMRIPILSRLWTKVYEIFRRYRKPLVLSNALFRLSVLRFIQKIFAIKSRSRRKTEHMQKF